MRVLLALACCASSALAQAPALSDFAYDRSEVPRYPLTLHSPEQLLKMKESQLGELFKSSFAGPVPFGYTPGLVIFKPGTSVTIPTAKILRATAWQGKYFREEGFMDNKTFQVPSIRTPVAFSDSLIDGKPCMVLDYAENKSWWLLVRKYRDEIREVSPGIYLGAMLRRDDDRIRVVTWFTLDARGKGCAIPNGK